MSNIISSAEPRDFYVYVDPHCPQVKAGRFTTDGIAPAADALMFVPNPNFSMSASPFQNNLVRHYMAEYQMETCRKQHFLDHPARLQSIFLLPDERAAEDYARRHPNHIRGRTLRRVKTVGDYVCSLHDSAWINYLRLPQDAGDDTAVATACHAYWSGETVQDYDLYDNGTPWSDEPIMEILYLGCIEFYSNVLTAPFQRAG